MSYVVTLRKEFKALQGLKSPIRDAKKLAPLQPVDGYSITLTAAIRFDDDQMGERGWFVDTDSLDDILAATASHLSSQKWTELFEFRPTFEQVARWTYQKLAPQITQLAYIELDNKTLGATVRYEGTA
ncbi:MAG: hypothetical protein JWN01_259 [Patescibacteria group bacterium]|nr:hypothetical protein [Patescibacteria group bacterium]